MTWSLHRPAVHLADALDAKPLAWAPEELRAWVPADADPTPEPPEATAQADEQDALIEAIAIANAARAREEEEDRAREVAEAFERGYEEGRREGETAEGTRLRNAVAAAERALDDVREGETRWAGTIEENICALAVAVARQILGRELRGDPDAVAELVRRALAEFPVDQPVRIRVNPTDLALLSVGTAADGTPISITPGRDASWLADALIAPGGCVVEGRDRIIDGRVDTALERVYRRLSHTHA